MKSLSPGDKFFNLYLPNMGEKLCKIKSLKNIF